MSYDFFMDLKGKLQAFLAALPDGLAERVEQLLKDTRTMDRDGNLVDRCVFECACVQLLGGVG